MTNEATNTTRLVTKETSLYAVSNTDGASLVGESQSAEGYGLQGTSPYIGANAVGGAIGVYAVSDYGTGVRALTYDGTAVEASTAVAQGVRPAGAGCGRVLPQRTGHGPRGHGSGHRERCRRAARHERPGHPSAAPPGHLRGGRRAGRSRGTRCYWC